VSLLDESSCIYFVCMIYICMYVIYVLYMNKSPIVISIIIVFNRSFLDGGFIILFILEGKKEIDL